MIEDETFQYSKAISIAALLACWVIAVLSVFGVVLVVGAALT